MRAFCYCRVSTEEQSTDDHCSLDNQEKRARDYAKLKNWNILRTRKDVAGKDTNRAGFQELVQAVEAEEIYLVLAYRLDRLSRNVRDIYDMLDPMREHDVACVSITEGFDEIAQIQMVDVVLPTKTGLAIRRKCVAQPTKHQSVLIQRLGRPADTITDAHGPTMASALSGGHWRRAPPALLCDVPAH